MLKYEEYENNNQIKKKRNAKEIKLAKKKKIRAEAGENMHNSLLNYKVNEAPVGTILCFIDCGPFSAVGPVICSARQISKMNLFLFLLPDKTEGDI